MASSYVDLPVTKKDDDQRMRTSTSVRAAFALFFTTAIDLSVSLATEHWATWVNTKTGAEGRYGLWRQWSCTRLESSDGEESLDVATVCQYVTVGRSFPVWYLATDVLMSTAMAGVALNFILLTIYTFFSRYHRNKTLINVGILVGFSTGACMMIGLALFGSKIVNQEPPNDLHKWVLSWSFTLACTAFLLDIIGSSLLVTERKRLKNAEKEMTRVQLVTSGPVVTSAYKYDNLRQRTTST